MTTLEPSVALHTCETALRVAMNRSYFAEYGSSWLQRVTSPAMRNDWESRMEAERRTREPRGVISVPALGLEYANFYDLVSIAASDWAPLAIILGRKQDTLPLLKRVERLRNSVGHNRTLLPFERDLLSGISGQIRNQVTLYLSTQDPAGDVYPRIEFINDSFGRGFRSEEARGELAGTVTAPLVVVMPGESVIFSCSAIDPQNRELEWWITGADHLRREPRRTESGAVVELIWHVTDADVRELGTVEIYMRTTTGQYHRCGSFDQRAYFRFTVRPPEPTE